MSGRVTWEITLEVNATKSQLYDTVEDYRYNTYSVLPSHRISWATVPEKGAIATILDNCPWSGHVVIHFYRTETEIFRLNIQAIQPLLSRKRDDRPAPTAVEYAQALATLLQDAYGVSAETQFNDIDDGWEPPKCIFLGSEKDSYVQAYRRLRERNFPVRQIGYTLWVSQPEPNVHPQRQYGQIRMYGITPWGIAGGHCRLEFELVPGETRWTSARPSIQQLIQDLRVDGWIQVEDTLSSSATVPSGNAPDADNQDAGAVKVITEESNPSQNDNHLLAAIMDLLTNRELEVFVLIMRGMENKEIADKLVIQITTVISHVEHISEKIDIVRTSSPEKIRKAVEAKVKTYS